METGDTTIEADELDAETYIRRWSIVSWALLIGFAAAIYLGFTDASAHLQVDPRILALFGLALLWHGTSGVIGIPKRMYFVGVPTYLFAILLTFYFTSPANLILAFMGVLGLYFGWKAYQIS